MHCKTCEYALWNIDTRQCPECGTAFRPSDFEFKPNSVCFCCPHCDQAYYGTSEKGHLVPAEFDCVQCGTLIHMDQMVLRPAAGVAEAQTKADENPWLQRRRLGFFKGWLKTIGMALIKPGRLMRATPREGATGPGWWFAIFTAIAIIGVGVLVSMCAMGVLFGFMSRAGGGAGGTGGAGGPTSGQLMGIMAGTMGIGVVFAVCFMVAGIAIWGALSHGILAITGGAPQGIGRTYQAICFAFGANVSAILLIFCGGQYVGWIWWVVSAAIMMKEAHRIHGGRAALATITPPATMFVLLVGLYIGLFAFALAGARQSATVARAAAAQRIATITTDSIGEAVMTWAAAHQGRGLPHGLMLVTETGVSEMDLVPFSGAFDSEEALYPGAPVSFLDFFSSSKATQAQMARDAAAALEPDVTAHRAGDYVFTWHGVDMIAGDRALWIMVLAPIEPDSVTGAMADTFTIVYADGSTENVAVIDMAAALARQNTVRAASRLAPLPDPRSVTQDKPAVRK